MLTLGSSLCAPALAEDPKAKLKQNLPNEKGPEVRDKPQKPVVDKTGPGPLTEKATEQLEQTRGELSTRQAAATNDLSGGSNAGCTGLLCLGSLTNAAQAAAAAAAIASYAANQHNQAVERRNEIVQQISNGAQSGHYPLQSVQQVNDMFRANPRPRDEEIQQLHPRIQDGATALRINQEERDELQEAHQKFTKTANAARGMHETLQGHANRGTTLAPGGVKGGKGNAAYPTGLKGGAGINVSSSGKDKSDITSRSEEQLETGRANGVEAGLGGGKTGGGSASLAASGKKSEKQDGKGPPPGGEGKSAQGADEGEGKKVLSTEAKALLAGMMRELKDDIAKGAALGDNKDMVVTDANGVKMKISDVPSGSALESMLITMDSKGGQRAPASANHSPAAGVIAATSGQQLSDLDFFGIDKSLFIRVKDYLRGRGQREPGFAGRN